MASKQLLLVQRPAGALVEAVDNSDGRAPIEFLEPQAGRRPAPVGTTTLLQLAAGAADADFQLMRVTLDVLDRDLPEDAPPVASLTASLRARNVQAAQAVLEEEFDRDAFVRFIELRDRRTSLRINLGRDGVLLLEGSAQAVLETIDHLLEWLNKERGLLGIVEAGAPS